MSKYTTELRYLRETGYDLDMKKYPIFDEEYREVLNKKILDHYNFREIGFETAGLFKYYLNVTLNEIMPYYNELYNKQKIILEGGIDNVNLKEDYDRKADGTSNSNSNTNNTLNNKNLFQDTPQGEIKDLPIANQDYATELRLDENNSVGESNDKSTTNTTENYIKNINGNNGNRYNIELLLDYKNNINNIDLLIIKDREIAQLFIGLW